MKMLAAALVAAFFMTGCVTSAPEARSQLEQGDIVGADLICDTADSARTFLDNLATEENYRAHVRKMQREKRCFTLPEAAAFTVVEVVMPFDMQGYPAFIAAISPLQSEAVAYTLVVRLDQRVELLNRTHGDAEWIMNHPKHSWCCGPEDCHALSGEEVQITPKGYVVTWRETTYTIPFGEAKPSIDNRYWLCEGWEENAQFIRCFFVPNTGA